MTDAPAFTVTTVDNIKQISYRGMGVQAAAEQGKHIIASLDGSTWFFYKNYAQVANYSSGYDLVFNGDHDTYFEEIFALAYVAVTDTAPWAESTFNTSDIWAYARCPAGITITDQTQIGAHTELVKAAPYILERTPSDPKVQPGKEYDITVTYSEVLTKQVEADEVTLEWVSDQPPIGAEVSNFQWNEANPTVVTFHLKTSTTYGDTTQYTFRLNNLVGVESRQAPRNISYYAANYPSFACPKVYGDVSKIHSSVPALISDSNLADAGWKDKDGQPIANYASDRLALVASEIPANRSETMVDTVEDKIKKEVLASQTFDISLTLCSSQVAYITGKSVKVFVPFPAGYDAQSNVTFKAYHFNGDTPEEIDCVTTESGIIMMCSSFSPFAVVAVEKGAEEAEERAVMTFSNGNGKFSQEWAKISSGAQVEITVTADEGYKIKEIRLNGEVRSTDATVTLNYNELKDSGNVLEASFELANIKVTPKDDEPAAGGNPPGGGGTPATDNTVQSPKTADMAHPALWCAMAALGTAGLAVLLTRGKKYLYRNV